MVVGCRHICGVLSPGKELFQTKVKIHKRLFAFLLVFALVIGLLPSVLADNDPSTAESAEETLVDSQPEKSPAIAPPTQSILESDEAVEDSEVEATVEVEDCDTDGSFLEAVQPASKRIAALVQKRPKNFELFIIQSPLIPNKIITSVVGVLQNFVIIVADKGRIDWARHE